MTKISFITCGKWSCMNHFLYSMERFMNIDGISMCFPSRPTLVNVFKYRFENIWLEDCPHLKPAVYRWFIDDTFSLFQEGDHADNFRTYLKKQHKNKIYVGNWGKRFVLSFLDITISRENTIFVTLVYRNSTFTGVFINF